MHLPVGRILLVTLNLLVVLPTTFASDQHTLTETVFNTLPSRTEMLSEKDYEAAPPNLHLEQVHVYVRHGRLSLC